MTRNAPWRRPPYPLSSNRAGQSASKTPFGYVRIEYQAGAVMVESAGERRMFEPGADLADFLNRLLGSVLQIEFATVGTQKLRSNGSLDLG